MTIRPKDCQTHHVQTPPKYDRRIPVIPIPDLPTTKAMAMTTTSMTPTQAQFIPQYLNQDLNPNPKTQAKYSPKPWPISWNSSILTSKNHQGSLSKNLTSLMVLINGNSEDSCFN